MKESMSYDDVIFRLGYFRNNNNLSARDTSLQLDYSESFINRIERKKVSLKVSTLLDFMELVDITPLEFFYPDPKNFKQDKEIVELILNLSKENKEIITDLAKKLKWNSKIWIRIWQADVYKRR